MGVMKSVESDNQKRICRVREKILNESIALIETIENRLETLTHPDSPPAASAVDDLGASAYANRDSSRGVPR